MKNHKVKIFLLVTMTVIVGFSLYWVNANRNEKSERVVVEDQQEEKDGSKQSKQIKYNPTGTVYFATRSKSKTDVFTCFLETKEPKKVFTDIDESEKIKSLGGISNNGKVLAFMSPAQQQFIGTLYNVLTGDSGQKEKLVSDFASSQLPKISPDGNKIVYTLFSNAEMDFGFKLIIANSDNTSKRELDTDSANLTILGWSPDSSKICYIKGADNNQERIYTFNIKSSEPEELTTIEGDVNSLFWGKDDIFVVSKRGTDKILNKTELYKFTLKKTKLVKITNNQTYESLPVISPDGQNILYFKTDYDNNEPSVYKDGEIYISDIDGNNAHKLADGNYPIGWLE